MLHNSNLVEEMVFFRNETSQILYVTVTMYNEVDFQIHRERNGGQNDFHFFGILIFG